jgi:hypothetical protein
MSEKHITQRHKERVEYLLNNKPNCKLKNISENWKIDISDCNADRVYIIDNNSNKEYSICFFDKKYGYDYIIYERQPIPSDVYNKMIKSRPELKNMNKEDLASIVEIDKGDVEIFIPRKKNLFEEIIEKHDLKNKIRETGLFILNVTDMDNIDNNSIQIVNGTKMCVILKMMTKDDVDKVVEHFNLLKVSIPDIEVYTLKLNCSKEIINDAYDYLENKGYRVETAVKPVNL